MLGGGIVGGTALLWKIQDSRKWRCFLFHSGNKGSGGMAGVIRQEAIFSDAPFNECHASTLAETETGLICAWFGGSEEGQDDVAIFASSHDQREWSAPRLLVRAQQADGQSLPCWNPVLWQEAGGPLHLFYKVGPSPKAWWGMVIQSEDGGRSWNEPKRLPDGILGPIKNKPVMLGDGRLLCPSSTEHDGWRVHFEWTADHGRTWQRSASIGDGKALQIIQPTLLIHGDRRLQALCRSRQGRIVETWSEDGGRSWSEPRLTDLPNPNSGFDGLTLPDGRHLLVYNPSSTCRSPLTVAVSEDGVKWRDLATLESERGAFSYPSMIQSRDGSVHISYTNRRTTITHVTIDPKEI